MPLVCLPLELCDDDAATLIEFLYDLTEALERHYDGQLLRRQQRRPDSPQIPPDTDPVDPPF
jgi:hypothetical protein